MINEIQTVSAFAAAANAGTAQFIAVDLQFAFVTLGLTVIGFALLIWMLFIVYDKLAEKFGDKDEDEEQKYYRF